MRIRPGYLVRINRHMADDEYPFKASYGDIGIVMDSDTEDIGVEDYPFFSVWVPCGQTGSYQDGFWASELDVVCDGKKHAHSSPNGPFSPSPTPFRGNVLRADT